MKTILFNLLLILAVPAFGQKYHIEGFIKDSFTKEGIDSAKITLMTMDSIEVDVYKRQDFVKGRATDDIVSHHHDELDEFGAGEEMDPKLWNPVIRQAMRCV